MSPSDKVQELTRFLDMLDEWMPLWRKAFEQGIESLGAGASGPSVKLPRPPRLAELRAEINHELTSIERLVKAVVKVPPLTTGSRQPQGDPFELLFQNPQLTVSVVRDLVERAVGEYTRQAKASQPQNFGADSMSTSTIQIFVSHAGKDAALAEEFVRWLEGCLVVPAGDVIRCTSAPGYKLKLGEPGSSTLRNDLLATKIVIGLMTDASLESAYVLMELGAAWALGKHVGCLVRPGVGFERIRGPIAEYHATRLDAEHDLSDVVDQIAKSTGINVRSGSQRSVATKRLLEFVAAMPPVEPKPETAGTLTAPRPDVRVGVAAGVASGGGEMKPIITVKVENHSPADFFFNGVSLSLAGTDETVAVVRDALHNQPILPSKIAPGDSVAITYDPSKFEARKFEYVNAIVHDKIGRNYVAPPGEMARAIARFYEWKKVVGERPPG